MSTKSIEIHGISEVVAYCEAKGFSKVFKAYADNCAGEDIMGIGFNHHSGYVYIALENGIQICSCLGQDVDFIVNNFEDGEESFYDTYEDALNHEENEND
jgi:hypothetical protein